MKVLAMAVKQNKSENSNQSSSAKKQKNSKQMKKETQAENVQQCNNVNIEPDKSNSLGEGSSSVSLDMILLFFEMLHKNQHGISTIDTIKFCSNFLKHMSELQEPQAVNEIKQFKENIQGIGELLKQIASYDPEHTQNFYLNYLKVVCDFIAEDGFDPCYAIAIVFELFPADCISKAVTLPLNTYGNDDRIIKKSVRILCDWLRKCTFCSNLNLWILSLLNELKRNPEKYDLLTETSLTVIEPLVISLIIPVLRHKVYPIVYDILSYFKDTSDVFHKILKRMPLVLKQLKKDCEGEGQEDTKKIFHELVDLMSAFIESFPNNEGMYDQLSEALQQYRKCDEYRTVLFGGDASYITDSQVNYNEALILNNPRVGLTNLGNTCYMNSVLQALFMATDFCRDLLELPTTSAVLFKIQQFFALLSHSTRPELTPTVILTVARPPGFTPGFQQDSSEFLGYLLETIHEQELKSNRVVEEYSKTKNNTSDETSNTNLETEINMIEQNDIMDRTVTSKISELDDDDMFLMEVDKEIDEILEIQNTPTLESSDETIDTQAINNSFTIIDKNFTGKIATIYKCLTCGFQSKNIDSFRDLQLSFPDQKQPIDWGDSASNSSYNTNSYSVQDLLDFYCSSEKLQEDNQYFCEKCKQLCDGERSQHCIIPPMNLILTLKQFKYDQTFNTRAKLMHKIYHNENLSLNIYSPNENAKLETIHYCMYAAVIHTGFNMDSGHYYTYAKDITKNSTVQNENYDSIQNWFKFNDNFVSECTEVELQNMNPPNTPYILFYRMKSRIRLDGCKTEIKPAVPPYLEELSSNLRNFVEVDNEEYKAQKERYTQTNKIRLILRNNNNRKDDDDDDDNNGSAGSGGGGATGGGDSVLPNCGENALGNNFNNYIY